MAEIVNLRNFKKQRARAAREIIAAGNRALFGQNKAEKKNSKLLAEHQERHLDAHKIDGSKQK